MINPARAADKEARRARLVALALDSAEAENERMLRRKVGRHPVGCEGRAGRLAGMEGQPSLWVQGVGIFAALCTRQKGSFTRYVVSGCMAAALHRALTLPAG